MVLHMRAGRSARIAGEPPTAGFAITPYYYTTIGLLVYFGPPRALLLMAAQALGFRSTGRGDPLDSRPGASGVGVDGSAWGYACGVEKARLGLTSS